MKIASAYLANWLDVNLNVREQFRLAVLAYLPDVERRRNGGTKHQDAPQYTPSSSFRTPFTPATMNEFKHPGVYIVETSAFARSMTAVATAVPAFIGYTEKTDSQNKQPRRITSMAEFHKHFGFRSPAKFAVSVAPISPLPPTSLTTSVFKLGDKQYVLNQREAAFLLYDSMMLFYQNGGGLCYIVPVGNYNDRIDAEKLKAGIDMLTKEPEPTILVVPDAVLLPQAECIDVQRHMLGHCGKVTKNRVAILDIADGYRSRQDPAGDPVATFRDSLRSPFLSYGVAYYPWMQTTINQTRALGYWHLDEAAITLLQDMLKAEFNIEGLSANSRKSLQEKIAKLAKTDAEPEAQAMLNAELMGLSKQYAALLKAMARSLNLLPPSAAIAGVYTMVDNQRGVWKAPANVPLQAVAAPAVEITQEDQDDLTVPPQGPSINPIRTFAGEGTLVWGARTLDGNSADWRYINVRRTAIMLEASIRRATKSYIFEPNEATTWIAIKEVIRQFLTGIWKQGGLAGAVPEEALAVHCGLCETMTAEDILEGILRVTVLVAISRPAEFIEITFQQHMKNA